MDSLPLETLHYIAEQLVPPVPLGVWAQMIEYRWSLPTDLRSLALVSRKFYAIAHPLLHRNLCIDYRRPSKVFMNVFLDPNVRRHVQWAYLEDWDMDGVQVDNLRQLCFDSTHGGDDALEQPARWMEQWLTRWPPVTWTSPMDNFCLFLIWLPNLKLVEVGMGSDSLVTAALLCGRRDVGQMALRRLTAEDTDLDHIRCTSKDLCDGEDLDPSETPAQNLMPRLKEVRMGGGTLYSLDIIMLHPSIDTIRSCGIDCTALEMHGLKWSHVPSNIRNLQLQRCFIEPVGLTNVLSRCAVLETLAIELHEDHPHLSLTDFGDSLRRHATRLTHLDIDTDLVCLENGRSLLGKLGAIKELTRLKQLKICRELLSEWEGNDLIENPDPTYRYPTLEELLPRSIEILYFRPQPEYQNPKLEVHRDGIMAIEIAQMLTRNHFPALRSVALELTADSRSSVLGENVANWTLSRMTEESEPVCTSSWDVGRGSFIIYSREINVGTNQ